ncbi:hypothetical protein [Algoriphagus algorifonticola]|uniref:hypothetical protein n=1 Tax=Algoriphagus algorifonticola TaxID=2593007 RepID=UPI0011A411EB|nr:hypothetical protein [Algoriphagus algorifonticola]
MAYRSNNTYGTLSSAPEGRIIEKVYSLVISVLEGLDGKSNDNENYLTNKLCKKLDFNKPPEYSFFFHHQNLENSKENTSTDFAVFGTYAYGQSLKQAGEEFPLVKFEAKRLSSTLPKKREREYVLGEYESGKQVKNSGGIERFKNLRHGHDVHHACILGYIQSDTFEYWENKINDWIKEEINTPNDVTLLWDENDILRMSSWSSKVCEYISYSKRKKLPNIRIRHLWKRFE